MPKITTGADETNLDTYIGWLAVVLAVSLPLYRPWVTLATTLILLLWLVGPGLRQRVARLQRHRLSVAVLTFLALNLLSLLWSDNPAEGLRYVAKYRYLLLIPVAVKPHLVFVLLIALAYWIIQNKRWKIAASGAAGFTILLVFTENFSPGIFTHWWQMDFSPLAYKTSTIITPIRDFFLSQTGTVPDWPVKVMPMVVALVVLGWLLIKRPVISWECWLPPLLALSLLFTPYAWLYDYTLLGIVQTALVVLVHESSIARARRKEILFWLAAYQGLVLIVAWLNPDLGAYYWFPFGMLLIWIRAIKITNMSEPPGVETLK